MNLFDTATNPAKAVFLPAAALLFRTGALPPAEAETVLRLPRDEVPALLAEGALDMDALWTTAGLDRASILDRKLSVDLATSGAAPAIDLSGTAAPGPVTWHRTESERPTYTVVWDPVVMATGYLAGRPLRLGRSTSRCRRLRAAARRSPWRRWMANRCRFRRGFSCPGLGRTINPARFGARTAGRCCSGGRPRR
ncbi:MAG: hypothetical protein M5U09_19100 [Gammaproteobacteria bacterium]|nr:hypothetical protein [Gammaproteobacteria bacterium]